MEYIYDILFTKWFSDFTLKSSPFFKERTFGVRSYKKSENHVIPVPPSFWRIPESSKKELKISYTRMKEVKRHDA